MRLPQGIESAVRRAGDLFATGMRKRAQVTHAELPEKIPRHVAFVMDGNGRWAQARSLPRSAGHHAGMVAMREIIRACDDWGVEAISLYAFSTENWARPTDEVNALMGLILTFFESDIDELCERNAHIRILGDIERLPQPQRDTLKLAIKRTEQNTGLNVNFALNYGGKAELLRATKQCMADALTGALMPEQLTEDAFEARLYTMGQPPVDLFIRTSGEMRTSNFLPWQTAYAEMIFNDTLWPDYTREVFREDLWVYAGRDRRFGKVRQ